MKKILRLITISAFIVLVNSGCSSSTTEKPKIEDKSPAALYADAKQQLQSANYERASEILEALDSRYPFGPHSDQIQLDLIYVYYKKDETALALANIDRFIRLNPTHDDLDYIYYMRALTHIAAEQQMFHRIFGINRDNRDPSNSLQAFNDLTHLINFYPKSQYAADAQQRLIAIKERLANYEISIAQWYIKREAYIAAINRTKVVLNQYPDSLCVEQALEIMIDAYTHLGLTEPKKNALTVLKLNYPNNALVRKNTHS